MSTIPENAEPTEPWTRWEVERFLRGLRLNAEKVKRIADRWTSDAELHRQEGYDSGYDGASEYWNS
jgi:hypothetical protein